jgi:hypothetical protein
MATRSKQQVYLLGNVVTELTSSKLPSVRMALGLLLHYHTGMKQTIRQSSTASLIKISKFWHKGKIPMQDNKNCITKLEKIFQAWPLLKKNKGRQTPVQSAKETAFKSNLDELIDIAHANALSMIIIPEHRDFLLAQRDKGRRGSMVGVDMTLVVNEKQAAKRAAAVQARRRHAVKYQDSEKRWQS